MSDTDIDIDGLRLWVKRGTGSMHEYAHQITLALDALAEIKADRDELRTAIFGSPDYAADLRNGDFREMAQATDAGRLGAIKRAQKAEAERDGCERVLGLLLAALPLNKIVSAGASIKDLAAAIKEVVSERDKALAQVAALTMAVKRVRHKKRASTYQIIGAAKLQTDRPLSDYAELTIYQGEDDRLIWARPIDEMEDGRFVPLPDAPIHDTAAAAREYRARVVEECADIAASATITDHDNLSWTDGRRVAVEAIRAHAENVREGRDAQ